MSLWVDKYRPKSLKELTYHTELSERLKTLASNEDFPHLLVYGPSGSGKKTRINCILRELFGESVEKLKVDQRVFVTTSNRKLLINTISSNYHFEMTPSDMGMYDRAIFTDLLKEIAQTAQLDINAKQDFKVVALIEADCLTNEAQAALRRTMEKYTATLRLILCCNSSSKIIAPIRSRCLLIRVASPSVKEIVAALQEISKKEEFHLPEKLAQKIATSSEANLRKAILMLETLKIFSGDKALSGNEEIILMDWEVHINQIARAILADQSESNIEQVRKMFYQLLISCIEPSLIIKKLAFALTNIIKDDLKPEIIMAAADYEHRLHLGQKAIFYLEAFAINVMHTYKSYQNQEMYGS
ncbi:hypothetical protein G9A89_004561 [Geosiphon pyriformis]|nr:hypothetical protein G9A89_004561 [Geosiphon pyriformis]